MKVLGERKVISASNAWGGFVDQWVWYEEIEPEDVGKSLANWGGRGFKHYIIRSTDVGRERVCYADRADGGVAHWIFRAK